MQARTEVERIRVVHFLPWLAGGGTEIGCRELVRALPSSRYEQRVVCFETRGKRREDFEALVPVTVLGGRASVRNMAGLANLVRELRAWKPHVLHASVFEGQVLGTLAGLLARVPVIVTEEATCPAPPRDRSRKTRVLLRQLLLRNDAVVAIAPSVKRYLVEQNWLPESLVHVIPYGVREPRRPSDAELVSERAALGIPDGVVLVGTVCRLHDEHKRVSDLIRALAAVRSAQTTVHLLIVGDGPDRQTLEALTRELGVEERVHWAGYRSDPASCFHIMDVFALTSALEGFGIVFAEAAMCGLPCIGSAVGGIVDAIQDGVTGILIPARDVQAIAGAMLKLAGDPALRRRMGEAGQARAGSRHTVQAYGAAFDALFSGALARRGIVTRQ